MENDFFSIFGGTLESDEEIRQQNMADIIQTFRLALNNNLDKEHIDKIDNEFLVDALKTHGNQLIEIHWHSIVRLSLECPLSDVRHGFQALKQLIVDKEPNYEKIKLNTNVSTFIPNKDIVEIDENNDEQLLSLFNSMYCQYGRVGHMEQILAAHPLFLSEWNQTISNLMYDYSAGPLDPQWRHYIAILAASRYKCSYLVVRKEYEFLMEAGEPSWVQIGLNAAPTKLKALSTLNAYLAHRPWMIEQRMIRELIVDEHWNIGELIHAILIMCAYHAAAGIVQGLGICQEIDLQKLMVDSESLSSSIIENNVEGANDVEQSHTDMLLALLKKKMDKKKYDELNDVLNDEKRNDSFEQAGINDDTHVESKNSVNPICDKYGSNEVPLQYADFDVHSELYSVFKPNEWSWKEHGVILVDTYVPEAGTRLERELDVIYNLTYNSVNQTKDIDTTPFRQAVWFYAHRLFGVCYDDYDYTDVNIYLNRDIKSFVKKVACVPDSITKRDFQNIGFEFTSAEKCHIALLAAEGHRQSSILYGLNALNNFTKHKDK